MEETIKLQSELHKTLSNASRMQVIGLLHKREMRASELIEETEMSKANLSQHMAILVNSGIVNSERRGKSVFYNLSDPKIRQACSIMQEVMVTIIKRKHGIAEKIIVGR
jgi:DNA-binding transcriptional ArsR family regulator